LPERRHPLRFGALSFAWRYEIETPPGWTAKRLPSPERIEARCLRFERSAETAAGKVVIEQRLVAQCDEIPPAGYAQHRSGMESIVRRLGQDLGFEAAEPPRWTPAAPTPYSVSFLAFPASALAALLGSSAGLR